MIHPPTIKQLRYLVALAEHLHFGRAARACHVSQSTLSAGIQELEALLDADLVDLRLGIIPTIAPFLLPPLMPALRQTFPKLQLYLKEALSAELCRALLAGELDVVLYALPYRCGGVEEEELFRDRFLAAFPPGTDPLPARIRTEDLDGHTLLLLEEGHCLRDHALAACSLPGVDPARSILGTSLLTLVQMVDRRLAAFIRDWHAARARPAAAGRPAEPVPA